MLHCAQNDLRRSALGRRIDEVEVLAGSAVNLFHEGYN
jgi:hypothetical protein